MNTTELLLFLSVIVTPAVSFFFNNVRVNSLEKEIADLRIKVFELETVLKLNKINYPNPTSPLVDPRNPTKD